MPDLFCHSYNEGVLGKCGKFERELQIEMSFYLCRLPPVTKKWTPGMPSDIFLNWGYTFQAPAWKTANIEHVLLTKVCAIHNHQVEPLSYNIPHLFLLLFNFELGLPSARWGVHQDIG
jgi:hypothetical protein